MTTPSSVGIVQPSVDDSIPTICSVAWKLDNTFPVLFCTVQQIQLSKWMSWKRYRVGDSQWISSGLQHHRAGMLASHSTEGFRDLVSIPKSGHQHVFGLYVGLLILQIEKPLNCFSRCSSCVFAQNLESFGRWIGVNVDDSLKGLHSNWESE